MKLFTLLTLIILSGCLSNTPKENPKNENNNVDVKTTEHRYFATLSQTQDCYEITVKEGVATKAKKVEDSKCDGSVFFNLGDIDYLEIEKHIDDYLAENFDSKTDNFAIIKNRDGGEVKSFSCSGFYNKLTYTEFYSIESGTEGIPYKTCLSEVCQTKISNGIHFYSKSSGTGCINLIIDDVYCDNEYVESNGNCVAPPYCSKYNLSACDSTTCSLKGFYWYNNNCHLSPQSSVPVCSISNLSACVSQIDCESINRYWWDGSCHSTCPSDEVATTRGCEKPITGCTELQKIVDNVCVEENFNEITGNICGTYQEIVLIKSGSHYVTCDTTFNAKVVVEPGAIFEFDDNWRIVFTKLYAKGLNDNHIVFKVSSANPKGYWQSISIYGSGGLDYDLNEGFKSGTYLEYVDFENNFFDTNIMGGGTVNTSNTYLKNVDIKIDNIYLSNSYVANSKFNISRMNISDSLFLKNEVNLTSSNYFDMYFSNSLIVGNTFQVESYSYIYIGLGGSQALFNDFGAITSFGCGSYGNSNISQVIGNKISTSKGLENCYAEGNSDVISDDVAVIVKSDSYYYYLSRNEKRVFSAYVFDKNGPISEEKIVWKATYDVNGVTYDYSGEWFGSNPEISFTLPETYELAVVSVNGYEKILGNKKITVNVQ